MNAIPTGSSLLVTILAMSLFVSGNVASQTSALPDTDLKSQSVSVETAHPLAMAHQQLDQAREHYQKGEIEKVSKNLRSARKWLQGHQTNNEMTELESEIMQLEEKINHPSEEHKGAILRLWHRSSVLVKREIEQIAKSWNDASRASTTLKYLIDARTRFSFAEYDLFINHNAEKARHEIDSTLVYLDKASAVASPRIREIISSLKDDIQKLPINNSNAAEIQTIMQALEVASDSIDKAGQSVSLEIQARSKSIAEEIRTLRKEIILLEKRQQYDSIMERLHQLDKLL